MKYQVIFIAVLMLLIIGCSSRGQYIGSSDRMVDLTTVNTTRTIMQENAGEILSSYIIDFSIPNPLFGDAGGGSGQNNDPSHESTIACRAVLLDTFSTEADILFNCSVDSLENDACDEYRATYEKQHVREGMFRIMLAMESGFSDKSMEPEHWVFYLETPDGVMIEPAEMETSPVVAVEDSVFSDYFRRNLERRIKKRSITFYFHETTFFGKNLLSGDIPYLVFVISRDKRTVTRIAWKLENSGNNGD